MVTVETQKYSKQQETDLETTDFPTSDFDIAQIDLYQGRGTVNLLESIKSRTIKTNIGEMEVYKEYDSLVVSLQDGRNRLHEYFFDERGYLKGAQTVKIDIVNGREVRKIETNAPDRPNFNGVLESLQEAIRNS